MDSPTDAAPAKLAPLAATAAWLQQLWIRIFQPDASDLPRTDDNAMESALDRLLAKESAALRERTTTNLLDFVPSEHVRPNVYGIGWKRLSGKVEIVRTVRAAVNNGYKVRVRAFARGHRGRVIVRSVDVDLRRAR